MQKSHNLSRSSACFLAFAGLSGCVAVAMGAVASHVLTDALAVERVAKASSFQFYHTLVLLAVVILNFRLPSRFWLFAAGCFVAGILLFSGALYLAAFGLVESTASAPFGGVAWMLGWLAVTAGGIACGISSQKASVA